MCSTSSCWAVGQRVNGDLHPDESALIITTRLSRREIVGLILLPVVLYLLWKLWLIVAVVLLAFVVAMGLAPAVAWFEAHNLGREIAEKVRGYLLGVALSGLVIGVVTGVGLALLGVPYAALFGVLAGLLEGIPLLGPFLAAVGPFAFALEQSLTQALLVAAFFIALQQAEDKILIPRLQSETTGLHPLTVTLSILVFGALFGVVGIILAVPLAAAGQGVIECLVSCFSHPGGTEAWMAACRPDLMPEQAQEPAVKPGAVVKR